MNHKVVIGLGFGDEGKGLFTDYLCRHADQPLVIRFSGGQQAGHTVVVDGLRHVFSNFAAGTLAGATSYFSQFCTIDPVGVNNELALLVEKDIQPMLFIDEKCPITTPYDIDYNQKNCPHGSCGVGVGDTINREEHHYSLTFADLFYPWVFETRLDQIKAFYGDDSTVLLDNFVKCSEIITHSAFIQKTNGFPPGQYSDYIYEGSQGLLLDQHYGFFPYVTRSNTGTTNVLSLSGNNQLELYLITRAYQTRHGSGPMSNQNRPHNILKNPQETNRDHRYQGEFRRTLLDLSLLEYAISQDPLIRSTRNKSLVMTCLDHVENEYRFTYHGMIIHCQDQRDFVSKIASTLKIDQVYTSASDDSKDIIRFS